MSIKTKTAKALGAAAIFIGAALLPQAAEAAPAAQGPVVQTVVTGLTGPLHVNVGPGGTIYTADAFAGQVLRTDKKGNTTVLASGLGFSPGVDVQGNGNVFAAVSGLPESGEGQGPVSLVRISDGVVTEVADLLQFELDNNPDGQSQTTEDALSNPYAVLALPGRTLVADAAANAIFEVKANGSVRTLAVLPNNYEGPCATVENNGVANGGCDAVPTDLALGPDGFLYVSGLGSEVEGFVYKVDLRTGAVVEARGGFPPLTGIAVGPDGTVYASSLFTDTIFALGKDGSVRTATVTGPTGLDFENGALYAGSVAFGPTGPAGSVLRISTAAFN